ncbi:MAG: DUF3467 domain-containing protein [Capnocytophaga sp.]|jgi:hypothetical protein|uniref:DUF3467 domain-containing protein n=1 Tax=Capnocytophaga sp. oral taxon 863 TaxID=1227265 RepID=UPI0003985F77|nr:DUF3467 domain-containing protein [Capnocytophaga sp. oral taxon 863]ERI63407.1 hypothetical protein HMPREF1551_01237 [Capnocytophaga sp. oral taxon 863 str. F0517]RKW09110.1 MAG: DUF3467 domain-containing protein [Capnocytophaga sp.]
MEKVTKKEINIEIDDKVASGTYANMVVVNHSDSEFVLDFISIMPGMPKARVVSRMILSPQHAKELMQNLSSNLYQFEHDKELPTDEEVFGKQAHFSTSGEA